MTSVTLMAVLHFYYPRINLFKLLLCWNVRIFVRIFMFSFPDDLILASCHQKIIFVCISSATYKPAVQWLMYVIIFIFLSFSKSTEDAWIVFVQVLCGWGNVWGSFSSRERIVVAFHFPGSCFTALGCCHGSVQMIFFSPSLWDNYLKPHPGVILCVGLNQQQG